MERRPDVAAASAAAASRALRAVLVVEETIGRHAGAARNVMPSHLRDGALERHFDAIELRRPLEDTVGNLVEAFVGAGAAEQHVHLVVVALDVLVPDRPVDVEAVAARGVELQWPVTQRAPAPEVGAAAEHARADP